MVLVILAVLVVLEIVQVGSHPTDPGVALATTGLALFTGLLFFAAAVGAYFAYDEITTSAAANSLSAAANSATLALQMDNRYHSDRALRIRHGAVTYLANHQRDATGELRRTLQLHCDNPDSISPYAADQDYRWNELTSDLTDIFNYFDWIAYLVIEKSATIDLEVNSTKRVNDLNADQLDGKSADDIGVNGLRVVTDTSDVDSASHKNAIALCNPGGGTSPWAVVGTGYKLHGANGKQPPEGVVVTTMSTFSPPPDAPSSGVWVRAVETKPVAADWSVTGEAICAKVGAP